MGSGPVYEFFLYINQRQVPGVFRTLVEAQDFAKPYIPNLANLQIKTTSRTGGVVRTWIYNYDIKQWEEFGQG